MKLIVVTADAICDFAGGMLTGGGYVGTYDSYDAVKNGIKAYMERSYWHKSYADFDMNEIDTDNIIKE